MPGARPASDGGPGAEWFRQHGQATARKDNIMQTYELDTEPVNVRVEALRERAERIVELVRERAIERANGETGHDWTRHESFINYVFTLRSVEARIEDTDAGPVVVAWPEMHPHGDYWTNIASEVLDWAAGKADDEAKDELSFHHARIEQADGSYEARLVLPMRQACGECGAKPDEDCKVPGCQGEWA